MLTSGFERDFAGVKEEDVNCHTLILFLSDLKETCSESEMGE